MKPVSRTLRLDNHRKHVLYSLVVSFLLLGMFFGPAASPENGSSLKADAGGPYEAGEGEPIIFDASASQSPGGVVLQYRWDFHGDGIWDTPFSDSPTATHTWSDDHTGTSLVEVRSASGGVPSAIEIIGDLDGFSGLMNEERRAQSFVAEFDLLTQVSVDVSLGELQVPNAPVTLAIRSDINGSDLASAQVDGAGMPGHMVENWVVFDIPDITLDVGNTYFVVLYSYPTNAPYELHVTLDAYPNGTAWGKPPGGGWVPSPTVDIRMVISGFGGTTSATDEASVTVRNVAPTLNALPTAVTVAEGDLASLSSTATDSGSDDLVLTWSWEMGPAETSTFPNDGTYPFTISDSSSHAYGDDGTYVVNLTVEDDDGGMVAKEIVVTVANAAPALSLKVVPSGDEGDTLTFQVRAADPGSDDLTYSWWGHCNGWSAVPILYPNDPVIVPDPNPSPNVNPRDVTDIQSVVCGDDGSFQWNVRVVDDDGGITTMSGTFNVLNEPPEYIYTFCPQIVGCMPTRYEGESTEYWIMMEDRGSDDITLEWSWDDGSPSEIEIHYNDGIGPDPQNSPNGTYPFSVYDARNHSFGDDGEYNISVLAEDDDGGMSPIWRGVAIINVAPSLSVAPPHLMSVDEGVEVTLQAEAMDPGSDDLTFIWSWDYGKSESHTYYNDGVGPDPPDSPSGTFPFSASDSSTHAYGDDCVCNVTLRVEDDDGDYIIYTTTIEVLNVKPSIEGQVRASAKGNLTLRVAGEKWHDVVLRLYDNSVETVNDSIFRTPGSPDEQSIKMEGVVIDLLNNDFSALVEYTPLDDPVNGQPMGATPAWLIFQNEEGAEVRLHHTFNVNHEATWAWPLKDLRSLLVGLPIVFEGTASDEGSDDLSFTWSWGDGTPDVSTIYYNDGFGPDPFPSPNINPSIVTDVVQHAFLSAGSYTVSLTVSDDDGGEAKIVLTITL